MGSTEPLDVRKTTLSSMNEHMKISMIIYITKRLNVHNQRHNYFAIQQIRITHITYFATILTNETEGISLLTISATILFGEVVTLLIKQYAKFPEDDLYSIC